MTKPTKRKKSNEDDVEEEPVKDVLTIAKAWELMKGSIYFYKSLAEYMEAKDDEDDCTELFAAEYFKDASLENKYCVPIAFHDLKSMTDNSTGEVRSIEDEEDLIEGAELKKIMGVGALIMKGYETIIMGEVNDSGVEILAVPGGVYVEVGVVVKKKLDFHAEMRCLVTRRYRLTVFAPDLDVRNAANLSYVPLSEVRSVLIALNAMAAKEDLEEWSAEKYEDADSIQRELKVSKVAEAASNFYASLLALKLATMEGEDRTNYFKANVSFTLARQLQLRMPHRGKAFSRVNNKPIELKPLTELADDDLVLLSSNVMSQREFSSLAGSLDVIQVIVDTDDVGAKKGNNWQKMQGKRTESAGTLIKLLTPILAYNKTQEKEAAVEPTTQGSTKKKSIKLD